MAAADWNRASGLAWVTVDDTGDNNIFGENCLDMGAGTTGIIAVTSASVNETDMVVDLDFYGFPWSSNNPQRFLVGLRVDDTTLDGYYTGFDNTGSARYIKVFKRVSGVLTGLNEHLFPSAIATPSLTLHKYRAVAVGNEILGYMLDASGNVLGAVNAVDTTFSGPGSSGLLIHTASTSGHRVDNFNVKQY